MTSKTRGKGVRLTGGKKAKTAKGKRVLDAKAPLIVENPKSAIFLRGIQTNEVSLGALRDLYSLKKPNAVLFSRKNQISPFEDASSLEFFSDKNDTSLFCLASSNKKRPSNLVFGRFFNHRLMDMIEVGITNFKSIQEFKSSTIGVGGKHMFLFNGQVFDVNPQMRLFKEIILDFFRGEAIDQVDLRALTTSSRNKIFFRVYTAQLKKSGQRLPRVELEEMGPSMDLVLRRHKEASAEVRKAALKVNRTLQPKKEKNVTKDDIGSYGRIHMERQDLSQLQTRKMKALKKRPLADTEPETGANDAEGGDAFADEGQSDGLSKGERRKRRKALLEGIDD
ncbi:hypothetical protein H696_00394 [Fonticula alba]|uniref:Ribosome production factor 2 homolog n=1 Tax=Fonticula alba TaxID=691883 RepID=A0A058ZFT5_FONAL|nr:hypothetical protein H696_00394 [Fonticula alba]KCV72816.1 hypothetical protein H696_00394 [Fonticula alba]|eukprot:XP_009492517.1 hypothetical protein H696_00394 [Fonticula alba]